MSEVNSFSLELLPAIEKKTEWFDTNIMPKILDSYRLLHTCIKSLYDILIEKSLITSDPYKFDRKISDIEPPSDVPFNDNERAIAMGTRLSDYESMLDFLCTYYKFSVMNVDIDKIKQLVALNNAFLWNSLTINNSKPNTRALAILLTEARKGASNMTVSTINDSVTKSGQCIMQINGMLKELTDLQREIYKGEIRKDIFEHPKFCSEKSEQSEQNELYEIKKLYPAVMGKRPFYSDLIDEILKEDHAPNKQAIRSELLAKLAVTSQTKEKKTQRIDKKELLMDSLRILGGATTQMDTVIKKIIDNHDILEAEHNSFFDKLGKIFRKAFNIPDPPVIYELLLTDPVTQTQQRKSIEFRQFISDLDHRSRMYAGFSVSRSVGYKRIEENSDKKIIEFMKKQLGECQQLLITLAALDDFFKNTPMPTDRSKIKGLKMEIDSIKNIIVKANQRRAEYVSILEEETQMKKLGITNAE